MHQIRFVPGLRPGLRWGSSRRSPDPLVGWGGDIPPHTPPPRRLRRLDLGACWFAPNLFVVPARLVFAVGRCPSVCHVGVLYPDG